LSGAIARRYDDNDDDDVSVVVRRSVTEAETSTNSIADE